MFVNVYRVTREYGGPEEGGWYYNDRVCVVSHFVRTEDVGERLKEHLENGYFSNEDAPPISSVLSNGIYEVVIEDTRAESVTEETPQYS